MPILKLGHKSEVAHNEQKSVSMQSSCLSKLYKLSNYGHIIGSRFNAGFYYNENKNPIFSKKYKTGE